MRQRHWTLVGLSMIAGLFVSSGTVLAQQETARAILESAADAMGGLERLENLENFVYTGFGQSIYQGGGGNLSPDRNAPPKWQSVRDAQRSFDLRNERALNQDRRSNDFPFAARRGHSWNRSDLVQTGVAMLNHPLTAVLKALDPETELGPVTTEASLTVVEFTIDQDSTLWIAIDPLTRLPSWVRWINPSSTLGEVVNTAHFTGYLPFDGVRLPVGLMTKIDWRDTITLMFQVDSYRLNVGDMPEFPEAGSGERIAGGGGEPQVAVTQIADSVWDVRAASGGSGGAVVEFADHLTMFEAYGSEANTLARIDAANQLVPGKEVTEVIVSHHHFDHTGGLRAAVSRGLTIIAHRGNEQIFEEMVAGPAPNFPDALARNPQRFKFIPVDQQLVLEDETMRLDVYHAVGHLHMANAVFAYIPQHRIFLEGDFTTYNWDWHFWGDAYLDSVMLYELDPAINIPVHGIVTSFEEVVTGIKEQVQRARDFCASNLEVGIFHPGCPVHYSHDID